MKPFCMFTGSSESPMYQWLASKQITLIQVRGRAGRVPALLGRAVGPAGPLAGVQPSGDGRAAGPARAGGRCLLSLCSLPMLHPAHCPQHKPEWKDALIRESMTGGDNVDKKVGGCCLS